MKRVTKYHFEKVKLILRALVIYIIFIFFKYNFVIRHVEKMLKNLSVLALKEILYPFPHYTHKFS